MKRNQTGRSAIRVVAQVLALILIFHIVSATTPHSVNATVPATASVTGLPIFTTV